jgi:hypothetical protein
MYEKGLALIDVIAQSATAKPRVRRLGYVPQGHDATGSNPAGIAN